MTTTLTLPDGFTAKALDAAASALDAVAAGLPFQVDDLIAGVSGQELPLPGVGRDRQVLGVCSAAHAHAPSVAQVGQDAQAELCAGERRDAKCGPSKRS